VSPRDRPRRAPSKGIRNRARVNTDALALAIDRGEWKRISWHLLGVVADVIASLPRSSIDEMIALLSDDANDI
jgi:hypothetical protein